MTAPEPTIADVQLTAADIATRLGVSLAAVRAHRRRATMPAPDGYLGRVPWWWESTIDAWAPLRRPPGQPADSWTPKRRRAHSARLKALRAASAPVEASG